MGLLPRIVWDARIVRTLPGSSGQAWQFVRLRSPADLDEQVFD